MLTIMLSKFSLSTTLYVWLRDSSLERDSKWRRRRSSRLNKSRLLSYDRGTVMPHSNRPDCESEWRRNPRERALASSRDSRIERKRDWRGDESAERCRRRREMTVRAPRVIDIVGTRADRRSRSHFLFLYTRRGSFSFSPFPFATHLGLVRPCPSVSLYR